MMEVIVSHLTELWITFWEVRWRVVCAAVTCAAAVGKEKKILVRKKYEAAQRMSETQLKFTSESFVTSGSLSQHPSWVSFVFSWFVVVQWCSHCWLGWSLKQISAIVFPLAVISVLWWRSYSNQSVVFPLVIQWQNCSLQGKTSLFHSVKLEYLPQGHCLIYWWR